MELISTLFATIFPATIISPALLILLESDIHILPSLLMQPLAYQRARTFNICIHSIRTTTLTESVGLVVSHSHGQLPQLLALPVLRNDVL